MKYDDYSPARKWFLTGIVALSTWNMNRLALASAGLTVAACLVPALTVKNELGGLEGAVAAFLILVVGYTLLSRAVGFWIINPLCGLIVLHKVHSDYGPKTRRAVLDWVSADGDYMDKLDVDKLARSLGEQKKQNH
ncbi:hypothetical protein [Aquipseudomonas alcaligenes]|uniref:Uncharacterized protein n=1 Tax=Aquipseudomonas alcaligenes TaxID=43263 RepID=A0AA37CJQ5_AQUAC|nr:hypothetical protein [Pseudomonas alcaligenes]BCR26237.1 hypothetical protein KAM426_37640 [Pseudomonas alcaligenes]GIZ68781.1 hypothetical protein KAM428_38660 [Pseudomonas alcaligenes]GIZ73165.1 hypothetical protein KAM429_39260 [Pseudomonas alcaligenes]GIZ77518.1 hypothetical protein KAM430_39270 [Pseudomonas alcaligenes]GIZ81827.1 hypothetical protein KAM432_38750 [Pseudomonas alcaligenes]